MNANSIPVIGWSIDLFFKASLALPFWLIWSVFGIGAEFFYFLPKVYHTPGFWDCVFLFIVVPIFYKIFIPKLVYISNSNKQNSNKQNSNE